VTQGCCATVYRGDWCRPGKCSRAGKLERNGKWYCATHDPVKIEKDKSIRQEKYESARRERYIQYAAPELLAALQKAMKLLAWDDPTVEQDGASEARAAIKKALG